ncbi:hypothetical protein [Paracoccus lutimaris]|uniref:SGNH/GDSL hydrolase family protein n=1 Tax=Paracoccus lutimaris TaxID=1490030 RepID=A0A368Z5D7_9RHOB|nr:hypothetical protein [Paracoccus lutimaris]RCW86676.1 hypothetical protein DFP89_10462 [Paracoccus lutimaris]
MKVTIFGDSHLHTLRNSAAELGDEHEARFLVNHALNWIAPQLVAEKGGIRARADNVKNFTPLNVLLLPEGRLYFSGILHTAPYTRARDWRSFCPWSIQKDHPDLQPISDAALQTWIERETAARLSFLFELRSKGFDICVIEAPRPLERAPGMHDIRPAVMARVDAICRSFILARLAEIGVRVIEVPPETVSGGFTTAEFSSGNPKDPHHGNLEYGRLMVQRIRDDLANVA